MDPYRNLSRKASPFIRIGCLLFALALLLPLTESIAAGTTLQSVDFSTLPGDGLQVQFTLSGPAKTPRVFHTDNPARVALDLPGVSNALDKKQIPVNAGGAQSIQAVEASGRTRVIVNLTEMMPYTTRTEGNDIFLILKKSQPGVYQEPAPARTASSAYPAPGRQAAIADAVDYGKRVENVDFRRGEHGEGRLLVTLSDPRAVANIRQEGRQIIVDLPGLGLPGTLARRLDVLDFATPVQSVESTEAGGQARLTIFPVDENYEYSSYQTDKLLTVELRPLTPAEKEEIKKKAFAYTGDKLSLNFQDIPIRSVLQILADFTNLNIVASDTVAGNVTLRLNEVPWDQALELVLKSKGLGKRQEGNIIRVAPQDEINKQEKEELEAQKVVEDLEPLRTEIVQINYTKAEDIKKVLVGTTTRTSESQDQSSAIGGSSSQSSSTTLDVSQSILSNRGNVTVDERTNQLIVKDTSRNIERVRELVRKLDIPVRQVLIESRIVIANNDFTRELGSRLAATSIPGRLNPAGVASTLQFTGSRVGTDVATSSGAANLLTSLGASNPYGAAGLTLLKAGDYLLDLELSAAQSEGRGEVISNPRLITSDQTKAVIKQGVEIPYTTVSGSTTGSTVTVQFKQAVLELNVTPHITPDDNILMDLLIKKDSKGESVAGSFGSVQFAIDKREIETTAQVANGETVVLGGVYEGTKTNVTNKVPFLGDLPGVGFMFRKNSITDNKKELLIFITPKILKQQMASR
ncbi:type IV pilus secretin PilQ [Methylococcus sp. EFPC2]|nr:type IV pilus secretin PilQ [Methylococcus sp. EFPC2]